MCSVLNPTEHHGAPCHQALSRTLITNPLFTNPLASHPAGKHRQAAGCYEAAGRWGEAGDVWVVCGDGLRAAGCYEKAKRWQDALARWVPLWAGSSDLLSLEQLDNTQVRSHLLL